MEEQQNPLVEATIAVKERAIANLNAIPLQFYTPFDKPNIKAVLESKDHLFNTISASLRYLELDEINAGTGDYSLTRKRPDTANPKGEIKLELSRSGIIKLARTGVKTEILQAILNALTDEKKSVFNLSNLEYVAPFNNTDIKVALNNHNDIYKILSQSLKNLGLNNNSEKNDSKEIDYTIVDYTIGVVDADKNNPGIIQLKLTRSGAEKLAQAGVKSEVLQTFLPLEERKQTGFAERVNSR